VLVAGRADLGHDVQCLRVGVQRFTDQLVGSAGRFSGGMS
jgi:hypothetical protein